MIKHLPVYITKCDVPGSQERHYGDSNNCTDGCLALVEHAINGKKVYWEDTPKPRARRLHYDDKIIHWLGIGI